MTQNSVAAPVENYLESEDLIFEIGDEDIESPKKKSDDDHAGYGFEVESEDEDIEPDDSIDEFEDLELGDGEEDW